MYLQRHQGTEAKVQLYVELMSNRERSDTDLRKEMFNSVITTFLEPQRGQVRDPVLALAYCQKTNAVIQMHEMTLEII